MTWASSAFSSHPLTGWPSTCSTRSQRDNEKGNACTHLDYDVIDFYIALHRSVAALHQPFDNKFCIRTDFRPCATDKGDANAWRGGEGGVRGAMHMMCT